MKKFHGGGKNVIGVLLSLALLLCIMAANVAAKDINIDAEKTIQTASLGNDVQKEQTGPVADITQLLKADSLSAKTHNDQGVIYAGKGEYDLAIAEFNKALDIEPRLAETYNNRGIAYSRKGQYDLSISDFTRSIGISPDEAKVYYNRGITYVIKGQYDLAISDFNKSLAIQPANAAVYDTLGRLHIELACSEWKESCRFGDCGHLREATRAGLCSEGGNSTMLP